MLFSFATLSLLKEIRIIEMHYSSSKMSSTKGNISKLSSFLHSSLPQISSLNLDLPFGKHPFCYYPVYFPLEIEFICKQFEVEHVGRGGNRFKAIVQRLFTPGLIGCHQLPYLGSRGPFSKFIGWNKPCLRYEKASYCLFSLSRNQK